MNENVNDLSVDEPVPAVETPDYATLPSDASSGEFASAIQALRPYFKSRTEYNLMVSDQLALREVPPNSKNVLDVGKWGSQAAINSDVRAWYSRLATQLQADNAAIPHAAKRAANDLMEQLWGLAKQSASAPLLALQGQLDQAQARVLELESQHDDMALAHSAEVAILKATIQDQCVQLGDQAESINQAQSRCSELSELVQQRDASIAQKSLQSNLERQAWDAERQRLESSLSDAVAQAGSLHEQLSVSASTASRFEAKAAMLEEAFSTERARLDAATRANAIAIDKFRVDFREAERKTFATLGRLDVAKAEIAQTREQLGQAQIEIAHLKQQIQLRIAGDT